MEAGGPKPTEKQTIHPSFFFNSLDILNSEVEICGDFFFRKKQCNVESKWPHYITYIH